MGHRFEHLRRRLFPPSGADVARVGSWVAPGRRWLVATGVLAGELAIALPFLAISPSSARGVPGPLLVLLCMGAAFVLGPRIGVGLTLTAVVLGIVIVGENPVTEPLVWLPAAVIAGVAGDRVRRGDELRRELLESLRQGLVSLVRDPEVGSLLVVSRYVPAERAQVLAGDFYGAIQQPAGHVAVMVGDVAGHGPRAAAVATRLRATWRGLASAEVTQEETIRVLNELLVADRRRYGTPITFATICLVTIDADQTGASVLLAGHPPPILIASGTVQECRVAPANPAIGVLDSARWQSSRVDLPPPPWTMMLYTDGLVEGRTSPGGPRPFGVERLVDLLALRTAPITESDADAIIATIREANGGPLGDDMVFLAASPRA